MHKILTGFACVLTLVFLSSCGGGQEPEHGFQRNGSYILFPAEQKLSCSALKDRIELGINNAVSLRVKAQQQQAVAIGMTIALAVLTKGRAIHYNNLSAEEQAALKQERAKMDAYNANLNKRGCKTVNIDAKIEAKTPKYKAKHKPKDR
jgi:hypothetical protein